MSLQKVISLALIIFLLVLFNGHVNITLAKEIEEEIKILSIYNELHRKMIIRDDLKESLENEHEKLKIIVHMEQSEKYNVSEESKEKVYFVEATAYTSDCKGCSGITAAGIDVRKSITYKGLCIIAADPNIIPLGTVVLVEGEKCVVGDVGGSIKGYMIDILKKSKTEAVNFGRRFDVELVITDEKLF